MADTSNTEPPKVDATHDAEERRDDARAETAQAEKTDGEATGETTTDPAPAHGTPTETMNSATAEPTKYTSATEAFTATPVASKTKAEETKAAGEKHDESKAEKTESTTKGATPKMTTFEEFVGKLPAILKEVDHDEMWGVRLVIPVSTHIPTQIVLQKFLNANDGELAKAVDQFKSALEFRKEKKPLELVRKTFSAKKFADLGAVTVYPIEGSTVPEVFTWNLYGNVKGKMEEVFVPLDEYAMRR